MRTTHHEIVVVGGGMAGLSAAWALRDDDVILLEEGNRVGGRVKSLNRGEYWVNLGAHLVGGSKKRVSNWDQELGLRLAVPKGSFTNLVCNGRIVRAGRIESFPLRLPIPFLARLSLVEVGIRLELANLLARQPAISDQGGMTSRVLPTLSWLDDMTFRQVLGRMHPKVESLMSIIANRITGELDTLSGLQGAMYGLETAGRGACARSTIVGGMSLLPDGLHDRLRNRILTRATVARVDQSDKEVRIEACIDGAIRDIVAEYCVLAVPAPVVLKIVSDLPEGKQRALESVRYSPWLVVGLFTRETSPMPWDEMYALAIPEGASFTFFFNHANVLRHSSSRAAGGSLMLYTAGDRARDLLMLDDAEIKELYLRDLDAIFPRASDVVDEVVIQRWPLGGPVVGPGSMRRQEQLLAPCGRLYFAGDYLISPGLDNAVLTGNAAAGLIQARRTCGKENGRPGG